jgi:hypothetical protein
MWERSDAAPDLFTFRDHEWSRSDGAIIEGICQRWALDRFYTVPVKKPPRLRRVK